jgi:hypothetical protein
VGFLDRFRQKPPPGPELDLLILRQLEGRGADLTRPRHLLQFLYFADEAAAKRASAAIESAGYDVTLTDPDGDPARWSVRAEATRVIDHTTVSSYRARFEQIADEYGGEYDGWEAAAEP